MAATLIRTIVFYFTVTLALRLMGKRQIGELQPGELVITIMISECAAAPMQDLNRPVISGIIAILTLVILEVLLSYLTLKLPLLRRIIDGTPAVVIQKGEIQQDVMKKLRLSVEDLTNSLRQKGYFKLEDIAYCIVETDGNLSVMPTAGAEAATAAMVGAAPDVPGLPCVIIGDGRLHPRALEFCGWNEEQVKQVLLQENVREEAVFLLIAEPSGEYTLIRKENGV